MPRRRLAVRLACGLLASAVSSPALLAGCADGSRGRGGRDPYDFSPSAAEEACLDAARREGWEPRGTENVQRLGPMAYEVFVTVQDGRRTKHVKCLYDANSGRGRLP